MWRSFAYQTLVPGSAAKLVWAVDLDLVLEVENKGRYLLRSSTLQLLSSSAWEPSCHFRTRNYGYLAAGLCCGTLRCTRRLSAGFSGVGTARIVLR